MLKEAGKFFFGRRLEEAARVVPKILSRGSSSCAAGRGIYLLELE
jgi:hypothetical protein